MDGCACRGSPGIKMMVDCATRVLKILPSQGVANVVWYICLQIFLLNHFKLPEWTQMHGANPVSGSLLHFCGGNMRFIWGLISSCGQNGKIFFFYFNEKNKTKQNTFYSRSESGMRRQLRYFHNHCVKYTTLLNIYGTP